MYHRRRPSLNKAKLRALHFSKLLLIFFFFSETSVLRFCISLTFIPVLWTPQFLDRIEPVGRIFSNNFHNTFILPFFFHFFLYFFFVIAIHLLIYWTQIYGRGSPSSEQWVGVEGKGHQHIDTSISHVSHRKAKKYNRLFPEKLYFSHCTTSSTTRPLKTLMK